MLTSPIDNILVEKANRKMYLLKGDVVVKSYRISLGKNPVGAKVKSGGDIMIHGYPNKVPAFLFKFWHTWKDWTAGCIAVTNDEIEEIYAAVKDGTPITIKP
jgi:murein L,D-transpeptidase YafK